MSNPFDPINSMQAVMNEMSRQWEFERSQSQMTLGKLIQRLSELKPEVIVGLSDPHSYRGYYSDLAFEGGRNTAEAALQMCKECMGQVFQGYKGGDFPMHVNSPVWSACYGDCGDKIMGINDDGTLALQADEV